MKRQGCPSVVHSEQRLQASETLTEIRLFDSDLVSVVC